MNLNLVLCRSCDLVFVDEPPSESDLASAYHQADFDSSEEADHAASAYLRAIAPLLSDLPSKSSALEIGTGSGAFLSQLATVGFTQLVGIEPSVAAIAAAPPERRHWIRAGMFDEGSFEPGSFDLICCFMTMEHVLAPGELAGSAMRLLRPGGAFVTVTHDYRSLVNRLLGRRSPIIDIEHMQIFSNRSIAELFARSGYLDVTARSFKNTYPLRYWWRLMPVPPSVRRFGDSFLRRCGLEPVAVTINVGNVICWGRAPLRADDSGGSG